MLQNASGFSFFMQNNLVVNFVVSNLLRPDLFPATRAGVTLQLRRECQSAESYDNEKAWVGYKISRQEKG